jgi:hypothetical protein
VNIKTAVSENGEDLYLIFDNGEEPFRFEMNVETCKEMIWLLADLVIAAEATQSLYRTDKITNCN